MKNSDKPAMPIYNGDHEITLLSHKYYSNPDAAMGLTKREMMAMHIAEGFVSSPMGKFPDQTSMKRMCEDSVALADLILAELDRTAK
ncbi:MAG: hypothetical protein ACRDBQ_22100 [Shewanella sp.]